MPTAPGVAELRIRSNYIPVLLSIVLITTTACSTTNPVRHNTVLPIEWGMTRSALEQSVGGPGQHQFRAIYEDIIYECMSYEIIDESYKYYFVFKENSLASIHTASKFWGGVHSFRRYGEGSSYTKERTWNTKERIEQIITAPTLEIDLFLYQLDRLIKESKRKKRKSFHSNIWPIAIAAVPFYPLGALSLGNLKRKQHKWRSQFDPEKVQLGMTEPEVIEELGVPSFETLDGDVETLSFGPKSTTAKGRPETFWLRRTGDERFWVSVSFENDRVVGIHSDDLFNRWEIVKSENYVER